MLCAKSVAVCSKTSRVRRRRVTKCSRQIKQRRLQRQHLFHFILMSEKRHTDFEAIHCGIRPDQGRFRLAPNGLGWKAGDKTTVVPAEDLRKVSWSRAARGFELRVVLKDNSILKFDNFKADVRSFSKNQQRSQIMLMCVHAFRISRRSRML